MKKSSKAGVPDTCGFRVTGWEADHAPSSGVLDTRRICA